MQRWIEEVWNQTRLLPSVFLFCMYIFYDVVRKQFLTIVEFKFFGILYSKFQSHSHFPFAVNCVLKIRYFAVTLAANESHVGVDVRGFRIKLFMHEELNCKNAYR